MNADPYGLARRLRDWGSDEPAFDALMALGPVVILAFVVGGRNAVTTTFATVYVLAFVVAVAHNAYRNGPEA